MDWLERVNRFVAEADQVLVVAHLNPDGDAVSSTLAAGRVLRRLGKRVIMVNESPVPQKYLFLPGADEIRLPEEVEGSFRHVMVLDCADRDRMGKVGSLLTAEAVILNVDHHVTNDHFGSVNVVLPDRAATAEILFDWIEALGLGWDPDLAAIVYTGLLTDTGGFRYSNTTPQLLRKAATLVEAGVKSHEIADLVLETVTLEQIRLLKLALSSLQVSEDGKMAWMCLRREDLQKLSVSGGDLDGIVNYARNITGVEVGMLFRETEEGTVKVSLRSRARVDVGKVAKSFGGGGHARASGCTLHIPMEEAVAKVKSRIREEWGEE